MATGNRRLSGALTRECRTSEITTSNTIIYIYSAKIECSRSCNRTAATTNRCKTNLRKVIRATCSIRTSRVTEPFRMKQSTKFRKISMVCKMHSLRRSTSVHSRVSIMAAKECSVDPWRCNCHNYNISPQTCKSKCTRRWASATRHSCKPSYIPRRQRSRHLLTRSRK